MAGQSDASAADSASVAEEPDQKKDDASSDEMVKEAREIFKLCAEREDEARLAYVDDVEFSRLGGRYQWPEQIIAQREADGLPCLTINQMPMFIHQVVNDVRQNKPSITVRPVDSGADRHTAQVIAGMIRHIENISDAETVYENAVDNGASGGFGYMRAVIEHTHDDSFDQDIKIKGVPDPLTIYGDPYSMSPDSLDWNDAFVTDWTPLKQFKRENPGAATTDFDTDGSQPSWLKDDEIMKAEWWHRDETEREILLLSNGWVVDADVYEQQRQLFEALGVTVANNRATKSFKVTQRIMTGAEILETNEWVGRYIPIIPVYGEQVIIRGKRHLRSMIRDAKDPQRNFNYWRSKASEAAALAPKETWLGHEKAFTGDYADRWDNANRTAWPFLAVPDGVDLPQRVPYGGGNAAALQQAADAANDIRSTIGIFSAGLGQPQPISGKAYNAQKTESDVANMHFGDNLKRAIRNLGIILLDLMPHVYTPGRIVRVLGPDGSENFATLGNKITAGATPLPSQPSAPTPPPMPGAIPGAPPAAPVPPLPGAMPMVGGTPSPSLPPAQPAPQQAVPQPLQGPPDFGAIYDIGLGKYDVVVMAGPGYTTKRQEAADQMMQLVQNFPQLAMLIGDLIAENLDWPGADEIARRLKLMLPPQLRQDPNTPGLPPQVVQMIQQGKQMIANLMNALKQCQQQLEEAKGDNTADVMKQQTERLAVAVDMFNAQTERFEAETKRGEAMIDAFQDSMLNGPAVPGAPRPGATVPPIQAMAGNPTVQS